MKENAIFSRSIVPTSQRVKSANQLISNHVLASLAVGALPIPLVDLVGLTLIQAQLIKRMAELYGHPYSNKQVDRWIVALTGGYTSAWVGPRVLGSLFKFVPVVGPWAGSMGTAVSGGAVTYALGILFRDHFQNGGSPATVKPSEMQARMATEVKNYQVDRSSLAKGAPHEAPVPELEISPAPIPADPSPGHETSVSEPDATEVAAPDQSGSVEPKEVKPKGNKDSLARLEGIGPKIQKLLNQSGIHTYQELAETRIERLREVLESDGSRRFNLADPTSWPEQARLAADGNWEEWQALTEKLKGGKFVEDSEPPFNANQEDGA